MNIKKRLAFVFALSALMLASCSNDEALVEGAVDGGQKVSMTVTAQREGAGANSRTSLEDNNTGKLDCVWTAGDRLIVTNAEGVIKGHLDLISGAGDDFASFSGDLYGVRDGEAVFNYYYLGTKNNTTELKDVPNPYTVDYSNQAGTLESLSEYDVMTATATVNVNKGNAPVENIRLARRISFARFQVNLPEDATVKHPCQVTLSGEQLANSLLLNMQTREVTTTKGNVTVTTSAEGDFYMTYLPTASPYTLTFTATDGTNTYEGEYTVKSTIGENVYFRKKLENADGVEYVGIPVTMQPSKKYILRYHANFEGANPEYVEDIQNETPANFTLKEYATTGLPSNIPTGYTFYGWAFKSNANSLISGDVITNKELTVANETDIYAVWMREYQLLFDGEGFDDIENGHRAPGPQVIDRTINNGEFDITNETKNHGLYREGYEFVGWTDVPGKQQTGDETVSTTAWTINESQTPTRVVTLYPVWKKSSTVTTNGYGHSDW